MTGIKRIISFDIGIKNLAYCILENNNIIAIDNISIIPISKPQCCTTCNCKASYKTLDGTYCKRHIPKHVLNPPLIVKEKAQKSVPANMIHDGIRQFIGEIWTLIQSCSIVLIENQPIYNHQMRNVQMILYTALREQYVRNNINTEIRFVNARKKTGGKGITYAKRKELTQIRAQDILNTLPEYSNKNSILDKWKNSKKKSDMADAICMCYDAINHII